MKKMWRICALVLALCLPALPASAQAEGAVPERLLIPSIGADSPMQRTEIIDGELQVMDGGKIVSYWGDGPLPGEQGNALLAAHNMWDKEYTPYSKLPELDTGESLTVRFSDGTERAFTVDSVEIYVTGQVPSALWQGIGRSRFGTMISCAGRYSSELGTHDRRCVITFSMPEHKLLNALERLLAEKAEPTDSAEAAALPPPRPLAKAPAPSGG